MPRELACFLRIVWDEIVGPIIEILAFVWITHLVASHCRVFSPTLTRCCSVSRGSVEAHRYLHLVVHTLTSLIRARQSNSFNSTPQAKRFLVIGQANAAGEDIPELLSVGAD